MSIFLARGSFFTTVCICALASSSVSRLYVAGLDRWLDNSRETYVEVSSRAGPRFLLQVKTSTSVWRVSVEMVRCWKGRGLVV